MSDCSVLQKIFNTLTTRFPTTMAEIDNHDSLPWCMLSSGALSQALEVHVYTQMSLLLSVRSTCCILELRFHTDPEDPTVYQTVFSWSEYSFNNIRPQSSTVKLDGEFNTVVAYITTKIAQEQI